MFIIEFIFNSSTTYAKIIRYGFSGIIVALSQFLSMLIFVEILGFKSIILENTANIISIEISILIAFFLHSKISWKHTFIKDGHKIKGFIFFHGVSCISFLIRIIMFAVLSRFGVDYRLNVVIGSFFAVLINFIGYDRLVFRKNV